MDHDNELHTDDAIAQALTSAIASRSCGDDEHAIYLTANVVIYICAVFGVDIKDFVRYLHNVDSNIDIKEIHTTQKRILTNNDEDDGPLPGQNAPTSDKIN